MPKSSSPGRRAASVGLRPTPQKKRPKKRNKDQDKIGPAPSTFPLKPSLDYQQPRYVGPGDEPGTNTAITMSDAGVSKKAKFAKYPVPFRFTKSHSLAHQAGEARSGSAPSIRRAPGQWAEFGRRWRGPG